LFEIGNTLREARVRRTLTLRQVEEDTKIRVKYVQAMENEDWDVMPGATYVKGFLRTYATYLGLDADVIIAEFRSRDLPAAPESTEPFGGSSVIGKPHSHRGRNTIVFVAVICLLVLGVIYALGMRSGDSPEPSTKPDALGIQSPSASPSASPSPKPSETAVKPGLRNVVSIDAENGDCWVQVRRDDAEGVVLKSGTINKGDRESFKGKVLWIRLGNPSAVRLIIEGDKAKPIDGVDPVDIIVKNGKLERQD
jgi:transcriptional regulator with XRE-family HTH domain